jgi:predicted NBD/HSP70 family sugar kinase
MSLRLNDTGYLVLGINIRPRHCQVACAGLSGRLQNIWTFQTPSLPEQLVDAISKTIAGIRKDLRLRSSDCFRRIGISVPGHVDASSGRILWTPTHPELAGFPIAERISRQTGVPVLADNDCNVGALSELWRLTGEKPRRTIDFVFLNISDFGVGAGAVLNGQLYLGHDAHFAGEFGHMVVEPSGKACRCGRRGCWELYVSNEATWNRYRPRTPFTSERFDQILISAQTGDETAMKSLAQTARYISLGISNIGFALNPAEVVVAGRIAGVWGRIRRIIETAYGSPQLKYAIRPSSLSADDSLLHGAVCLALRDDFAAPKFGAA